MPDPLAAAGVEYLVEVLRAAISVPAAAADPSSGSIAGGLVASLAARHHDEALDPFFAWDGRAPVSYEVRCYDTADTLVSTVGCTGAGEAVRTARTSAGQGLSFAEVVVRVDSGEERWMLHVRDRVPVYRMPDPGSLPFGSSVGPGEAAGPSTAVEVVEMLREVLSGMTVQVDATAIDEAVRRAVDELSRNMASLIPSAAEIADLVARNLAANPGFGNVVPAYEPLDPAAQDALAAEQPVDRWAGGVDTPLPRRQGVLPPARTISRPTGSTP